MLNNNIRSQMPISDVWFPASTYWTQGRIRDRYPVFPFLLFPFLDASSHLYNRVCPSVRPTVRISVRRSVRHAFVNNYETTFLCQSNEKVAWGHH